MTTQAEPKVCTQCKTAPATTTRPMGVSMYFDPRPEDPRVDLCEPCALQTDRDVREVHLDWQQEW